VHHTDLCWKAAAALLLGDITLAYMINAVDCAGHENILQLAGLGLGGYGRGFIGRKKKALKELFRLPDHIQPFSVISLGYPAEKVPVPNRFRPDRIHENGW
jgi:nitroreductase